MDGGRPPRSALVLEPRISRLHSDRGWDLIESSLPAEARPYREQATDLDPRNEMASANLEACRRVLGATPGGVGRATSSPKWLSDGTP